MMVRDELQPVFVYNDSMGRLAHFREIFSTPTLPSQDVLHAREQLMALVPPIIYG